MVFFIFLVSTTSTVLLLEILCKLLYCVLGELFPIIFFVYSIGSVDQCVVESIKSHQQICLLLYILSYLLM